MTLVVILKLYNLHFTYRLTYLAPLARALFTLPAQPQGTVSDSFLSLPCRRSRRVLYLTRFFLSLSCRRSRRILFPTRFLFFILPAQPQDIVSYLFPLSFLHIRLQNGCVLFLLRSSFFLSTEHISWTIEPILMKLGHNNHWTSPHIWHDIWPRNCPLGVTGVKKVILAKIHQLLQFA